MTDNHKAKQLEHMAKTDNAFCATGEGGGQDNSCSPTGEAAKIKREMARVQQQKLKLSRKQHTTGLNAHEERLIGELYQKYEELDSSYRQLSMKKNVFCATGEGGGVDPSCGNEGGTGGGKKMSAKVMEKKALTALKIGNKKAIFEVDYTDGGVGKFVTFKDKKAGGWVTDVYYREDDNEDDTLSEGLFMDGVKTAEQAVKEVLGGMGGLISKPHRVVNEASVSNALMMPLLPKALREETDEEGSTTVPVSIEALRSLKVALDEVFKGVDLAEGDMIAEGEEAPEDGEPPEEDELAEGEELPADEEVLEDDIPTEESEEELIDEESEEVAGAEESEEPVEEDETETPVPDEESDELEEDVVEEDETPKSQDQFKKHKFVGRAS